MRRRPIEACPGLLAPIGSLGFGTARFVGCALLFVEVLDALFFLALLLDLELRLADQGLPLHLLDLCLRLALGFLVQAQRLLGRRLAAPLHEGDADDQRQHQGGEPERDDQPELRACLPLARGTRESGHRTRRELALRIRLSTDRVAPDLVRILFLGLHGQILVSAGRIVTLRA